MPTNSVLRGENLAQSASLRMAGDGQRTHTGIEQPGEGAQWMRRAIAGCYFHSGMPLLARRLRERYQLSFAQGENRRPAIRRRTQCSARILYYHRVNDDHDPFFDAMPTAVFERQIQYLTRHYRVVSMSEIVRRLEEGGRPEMLVGITFDDGYGDNYWNAFPILRRYHAPATIFLTTGSIDSRTTLWFEQLAEAVANSSLEFIDLELDVPCRLALRTRAERLEANSRVFSFFRGLSDTERNLRLPAILRRLHAKEVGERPNKMLTWEQVRLMKGQGIDFGGHTVTHPFLSRSTPSEAAWEVSECKRRIEDELQQRVEHFAYPNGREKDFSPAIKSAVREAGYKAAMTTIWGMNLPGADLMELRRGGPWESNSALFAWKLDWYQLVNK